MTPLDRTPGSAPTPPMLRVVVVEDLAPLRELLRRTLEQSGAASVVAEAGDGHSGLAAVSAHQPDIVVTDLRMPVLDGFELARRLRADHPDVGIVMLTGALEPDVLEAAFDAGVHAFVEKRNGLAQVVPILRDVAGQLRRSTPA